MYEIKITYGCETVGVHTFEKKEDALKRYKKAVKFYTENRSEYNRIHQIVLYSKGGNLFMPEICLDRNTIYGTKELNFEEYV